MITVAIFFLILCSGTTVLVRSLWPSEYSSEKPAAGDCLTEVGGCPWKGIASTIRYWARFLLA